MDTRALGPGVGPVAGALGGLCWVVRWVVTMAGGSGWDALRWAGIVMLAVALAVVGAGLVSRSALWLRLIVAVAFPALVWSLFSAVRGAGEAVVLEGVIGLFALVVSTLFVVAARRGSEPAPGAGRHGSHAAR